MTILCDLARKHETDKGGQHLRYGGGDSDTNHNYTPVYHDLLGKDRDAVQHVLEIGVHAGSSLRMWKEYFPFAQIVGIDTNQDCLKHIEPRIKVFMADQNNPSQLLGVIDKLGRGAPLFDLIVDDGSHVREHQITSLTALLPFMAFHGVYVIEDLGTGDLASLDTLIHAIPAGYLVRAIKITGGLGPKVQPHEWLVVIRLP